jgi:hypothetical protein
MPVASQVRQVRRDFWNSAAAWQAVRSSGVVDFSIGWWLVSEKLLSWGAKTVCNMVVPYLKALNFSSEKHYQAQIQ